MKKSSFALVLTAILIAAPASADPTRKSIQCWTDNKGQRMCGDRVPPEYAGQERKVMNDRGMVVETKKGAKTAEEIAAEERKAREAEEVEKRAAYDRSLLESYRNAKDIENMRDERLAMLDTRIQAAQKSITDNEKTLRDLHARSDEAVKGKDAAKGKEVEKAKDSEKGKEGAAEDKAGTPAEQKLAKQIRQYERSLKDSQASLARLTEEREQTQKKYGQDLQRYNELRPPAPVAAKKPTP